MLARPSRVAALLAALALPLLALPVTTLPGVATAAESPQQADDLQHTLHSGSPAAPGLRVTPDATRPANQRTIQSAALGGSIVFIRNANVWLIRPDGTGLHQVTSDGTTDSPYEDPTMSDTGVIAVARGGQIIRMLQNGVVLGVLAPPSLFLPSPGTLLITPIHEPVISPDGSRIAYSQLRSKDYSGRIRIEELTSFTDATGLSPTTTYGIVSGREPAWLSPTRVVLSSSGIADLQDLGHDEATTWFYQDQVISDEDGYPLQWHGINHPEVSADLSRVTYLVGDDFVGIGSVTGDPRTSIPAPPTTPACFLASDDTTTPGPVFDSPSLGPDGRSVAYEELGDLWVVTSFDTCDAATSIRLLVPGGTNPDWSAAPLAPPALPAPPPVPGPGPKPAPGPGGGGAPGAEQDRFAVKAKAAVQGSARVGRTLTLRPARFAPSPQRTRIQWLRNGAAIKRATKPRYRLTAADRGRRISVRVTAIRAGYDNRSVTSAALRVR